jgi:hypothetical protein
MESPSVGLLSQTAMLPSTWRNPEVARSVRQHSFGRNMRQLHKDQLGLPKRDVPPGITEEQFAALKEVANKPMHCAISDEHRDRLIAAGYIREVRNRSGRVYAFVLTRRGLKQLARGKYFLANESFSFDNAVPKKAVRSTKHR